MTRLILICNFLLLANFCKSQQKALNIPGVHQLVSDSKSENKLQIEAKKKQAIVSSQEYYNQTMLAKLKNKYRELQNRYNTLGTIINAASIGVDAAPVISRIVKNQIAIYQVANKNLIFLPLAIDAEVEFVNKAQSLLNYLIGLSVSIDIINQMRQSERKILFDNVLSELFALQRLSSRLLSAMQSAQANTSLKDLNPFQGYINEDKEIINDIIRNSKNFKKW